MNRVFNYINKTFSYLSLTLIFACSQELNPQNGVKPEIVQFSQKLTQLDPITYQFNVLVTGPAKEEISYSWDFGDGTIIEGAEDISHSYDKEGSYVVVVQVSDQSGNLVQKIDTIQAEIINGTIDRTQTYQTIAGFGGHDARNKVDQLVNDLGMSVHRGELKWTFQESEGGEYDFEAANSNSGGVSVLKELAGSGVTTFIATLWSPPAWMKINDSEEDVKSDSYPNETNNKLKEGMEDELAEYIVQYIKMFEAEIGIPLYAISVQNEPYFTQTFQSCMYSPEQLAKAITALGKKLEEENLNTLVFGPEHMGSHGWNSELYEAILDDPEVEPYLDIYATHSYIDGVSAGSNLPEGWINISNRVKGKEKDLWMTETSGYSNTWERALVTADGNTDERPGGFQLGEGIFNALKFGQVSAWVWWRLAVGEDQQFWKDEAFILGNTPNKFYYSAKQFFRYIRPGDIHIGIESDDSDIKVIAFENSSDQLKIVVINSKFDDVGFRIPNEGEGQEFQQIRTSEFEDAINLGKATIQEGIVLPARSITTLTQL